MAQKISFTTVREVSLEALISSVTIGQRAQHKSDVKAKDNWAQTVLYIHNLKPLNTFDHTKEEKEIAEAVRQVFKDQFIEDRMEIDGFEELTEETEGFNMRTKQMTKVLKDGEPIWSSWIETKLPISYCGDIAKVIRAQKVGDVLPSPNKVMSRGDTLRLCKTPETPLQTITRSCEMIVKKSEAVKADDFELCILEVEQALKALKDAEAALALPKAA